MKIICVGRNYVDHIRDLGNEKPDQPVFFLKPDTALMPEVSTFHMPDFSNEIHYEVEMVLRISRDGKSVPASEALSCFDGIGLGIDFTARDVQNRCMAKGLPWEAAKAFDGSAPVSRFHPVEDFHDIAKISFSLKKNGKLVQAGNTADMMFSCPEIISHVSRYITLKAGDLVFTGTPVGVGKVEPGDELTAYLEDKRVLRVKVE